MEWPISSRARSRSRAKLPHRIRLTSHCRSKNAHRGGMQIGPPVGLLQVRRQRNVRRKPVRRAGCLELGRVFNAGGRRLQARAVIQRLWSGQGDRALIGLGTHGCKSFLGAGKKIPSPGAGEGLSDDRVQGLRGSADRNALLRSAAGRSMRHQRAQSRDSIHDVRRPPYRRGCQSRAAVTRSRCAACHSDSRITPKMISLPSHHAANAWIDS